MRPDERLPAAEIRKEMESPFLNRRAEITVSTGDLPHWHQDGKIQFVTFRLSDSLPKLKSRLSNTKLPKLPRPWNEDVKKEYWSVIAPVQNKLLDNGYGACIIKDPCIRKIVPDAILFMDGRKYHVSAFVIMPNNVHMLLVGRTGSVWKKEYFDRIIRNERHLLNCLDYIRKNPRYLREGEYQVYVSAAGSRLSSYSSGRSSSAFAKAEGFRFQRGWRTRCRGDWERKRSTAMSGRSRARTRWQRAA